MTGPRRAVSVRALGLLVLASAAGLVLIAAFRHYEHPSRSGPAAYLCARDYLTARTAADTAVVDGRRYPNGKIGPDLSCGIRRRSKDWPI